MKARELPTTLAFRSLKEQLGELLRKTCSMPLLLCSLLLRSFFSRRLIWLWSFGTQDVRLLFEWHIVLKLARLFLVDVVGCLYFR